MNNFKIHFWRIGQISFPLTLATASGTILILIDSFFAAGISIESYEAVFLTLPIMGLSTGIGIGLSAAIADLVSKEKELLNIKRLISASLVLSVLSILTFLYIALFHNDIIEKVAGIHKLETDSLISSEFRAYWKVILWTFPMQIFFSLTMQFLTILEKQKTGMYVIFFNLFLNVFLDYLFTIVLGWGVEGLAYSTMGVFTSGVLLTCWPLRKESYFKLPYPSILTKKFLRALSQVAITTFMIFTSVAIFSISAIILNQIALGISTAALVVYAIYSQIARIFIITTRGLAGGFIIYLGNAIRDQRTKDYFPIYWAATAWIAVFNLLGAVLMLTIPTQLINLYENVDINLYPNIIYFLSFGALIMCIYILPRMATIGFISINKAPLLVLHSFIFVMIQLSTAYYWTAAYGMNGLIHAELAAGVIASILFLPLFFYFLHKERTAHLNPA